MKVSENAISILAAKTYKGIGTAWIVNNLKAFESPEKVISLIKEKSTNNAQISIPEFEEIRARISGNLQKIADSLDGVVALGDRDFPSIRGDVKKSEQPTVLFYKGDISLLGSQGYNVATIGLLKPSEKIEKYEQMVVAALVKQGANIVSGLALGCDTIAHRETLTLGGKTIAFLPNTIKTIMPSRNSALAQEIVEAGGLLVSEYYKEFFSQRELIARYIERDRLQALFSDGIVLSASYAKNDQGNDSGSRHAMEYAKSYGIPRAVIFNEDTDRVDEQYALNRQILQQDSNVFALNPEQLKNIEEFIVKTKSKAQANKSAHSLFN